MQSIEILNHLRNWQQHGILTALDVQFARFLTNLTANAPPTPPNVTLAAALSSYFTTQGHVCIDLASLAEQPFPDIAAAEDALVSLRCPPLTVWQADLAGSPLVVKAADAATHPAPLVLDATRVYLYRYWQYEQQLIANIKQRLAYRDDDVNLNVLEQGLIELFGQPSAGDVTAPDWQRIAAHTAVLRHFCIISGGPGTGKTSTVVKILLLLLMQNPRLRIALAAPTGKAAARMQEAMVALKPNLNCAAALKALIPEDTYTLHRLLVSIADSPYFRHHADNPLLYDVVVVDEASMVDLALMAKLAQAMPLATRWILLGDKDQLASVETGTILGDLCSVGQLDAAPAADSATSHALADCIVLLRKSYRFQTDSGIGQLARHVQQGDAAAALACVKRATTPDLAWFSLTATVDWQAALTEVVLTEFHAYLTAQHPRDALQTLEQFRILCALRRGPFGVEMINRVIERILIAHRYIEPGYQWYHRRPIMITRNDYNLALFNGDIGVVFWNPQRRGELHAFFPTRSGELRSFGVNRLPEHETVYAMTIHKSQGSEFDRVLMLLSDHISPVLSRELVYTGITRARQQVQVWSDEAVFTAAVQRQIYRTSGLREAF